MNLFKKARATLCVGNSIVDGTSVIGSEVVAKPHKELGIGGFITGPGIAFIVDIHLGIRAEA